MVFLYWKILQASAFLGFQFLPINLSKRFRTRLQTKVHDSFRGTPNNSFQRPSPAPNGSGALKHLREVSKVRQMRMAWLLICAALAIGISGQAQAPPPAQTVAAVGDRLTPGQALNLRTITDLRFSPDGEQVAFVLTEPVKGTT